MPAMFLNEKKKTKKEIVKGVKTGTLDHLWRENPENTAVFVEITSRFLRKVKTSIRE